MAVSDEDVVANGRVCRKLELDSHRVSVSKYIAIEYSPRAKHTL